MISSVTRHGEGRKAPFSQFILIATNTMVFRFQISPLWTAFSNKHVCKRNNVCGRSLGEKAS